jgi:hypothetical protein
MLCPATILGKTQPVRPRRPPLFVVIPFTLSAVAKGTQLVLSEVEGPRRLPMAVRDLLLPL